MLNILLAVILGSFFGFALYYVGAAYRKNIRKMLRLEDLSLMKIILFAIGYAGALFAGTILLGIVDIGHMDVKTMDMSVVLGGIIFGLGFGVLGSCPGTALASFPYKNKVKTWGVVIGGLFGALLFSLSYGWWKEAGLYKALAMGKVTIFKLSPKFPSLMELGAEGLLAMGLVMMAIAWVLPQKLRA